MRWQWYGFVVFVSNKKQLLRLIFYEFFDESRLNGCSEGALVWRSALFPWGKWDFCPVYHIHFIFIKNHT